MKLYLALTAATGLLLSSSFGQTFTGNGGMGFGGPIGTGSITVTENTPGTLSFSLSAGPDTTFTGNVLVLYFDTAAGGFADTSMFTDFADPGRRAVSGADQNTRTPLQFPAGFTANFALAVEPMVTSLFGLVANTSLSFIENPAITGTGAGPFSFNLTRSSLGLAENQQFQFVGSLISGSAYRSNETFGTSLTVPGSATDAPNAGFTGTTTISEAFTVIPEPGTVGLLTLSAGLLALRRRR
jgi:hypothetical protein